MMIDYNEEPCELKRAPGCGALLNLSFLLAGADEKRVDLTAWVLMLALRIRICNRVPVAAIEREVSSLTCTVCACSRGLSSQENLRPQ